MNRVLIVGAGIAGPTLAYWLLRAGMTPTLIESAPALRTGGYMIDFWGPGYLVAERMGLTAQLRDVGYAIRELRVMDRRGRPRITVGVEALRRAMGDRFISLLRGDLAAMLYHSLGGDVETLFGTEVRRLLEHDGGIDVELAGGEMRRFDLVIGADGLHSGVRHLMLGTHRAHEYDLGYRVAAFTAREYPYRNELVYVTRTVPGRQVARCALRDGRTVFFMIMGSELIAKYDVSSVAHQKRALRDVFAHIGTEQSAVRQALDSCDDLYFDSVSQARVPQWSRGRIALVGDAAYGPSLLAGEGTSLAMAGAYVLAGELATAGDASIAFSNYERRLKSHMDRKQRQATRMGSWFAPRTQPGLWIRNSVTALASVAPFSKLLLRGFDDGDLPMPQQLPAACAPP